MKMLTLRPITPTDNSAVARIVRAVMPEFGCVGEGFSINDPELEDMFTAYHQPALGILRTGGSRNPGRRRRLCPP